MLRLILVRHGHTIWHDAGRVAGRSDIALSGRGESAVRELARSWHAALQLDSWHSSPLQRTMHTTQLLRDVMAPKSSLPHPITDKRLMELDFGSWEGMSWHSVHDRYKQQMQDWGEDWVNRSPPNGESFSQQHARCVEWLRAFEPQPDRTHNAMVVLHGGSIRALLCHCMGWSLTQAMDFQIDPASVTVLDRSQLSEHWTVRKMNSLSF